jgi:hypothetical protein
MNRPGFEKSQFFVGTEVEHTPVHGHRTLFVIGLADIYDIESQAKTNNCTHIYFGANHSFPVIASDNAAVWSAWESMIKAALRARFWCTLDLDVSCITGLHESGLTEFSKFIPMISVKIPYLQLLGYNATIKIDDIDFDKTNPGVWCHRLHQLMNPDIFTSFTEYSNDETL